MPFDTAEDPDWQPLVDAALGAMACAYAPYSRFEVGAALLSPDRTITSGCNVENASYGATICAERVAIGTAVASGRRSFEALVVTTPGPEPSFPCGMCRQVIGEFARSLPILLVARSSGTRRLVRFDEIFPGAFGPADLA
jgi:cytidine deaminase